MRAIRELDGHRGQLLVGLPVLTEALHLLVDPGLRRRLRAMFELGAACLDEPSEGAAFVARCLSWLERYAEHQPDFTDAFLVNRAASSSFAVWTFDREFHHIWRGAGGRRVRLVPSVGGSAP